MNLRDIVKKMAEKSQQNINYYFWKNDEELDFSVESEKLKLEENKLFSKWKEKYDIFVPDGMVDSVSYISSWLKITFILKEVNAKDSFELMDFLRQGAVGSTWNNIARWSAGILFNKQYNEVEELNGVSRKKYLEPISVINLKKTPGGANSDYREIEEFAKSDRVFINQQLEIYKPDIIICCGTGNTFLNQVLDKGNRKWIKESKDLWYIWDGGRLIISTWHPQQRSKGRSKEYLFEQIPMTINKIIYRTISFLDDMNEQLI